MSIISKKHFTLTLTAALSAALFGEFAYTHEADAKSSEADEAFATVEMEIEGIVYDVKVRKEPPVLSPSVSAYFY